MALYAPQTLEELQNQRPMVGGAGTGFRGMEDLLLGDLCVFEVELRETVPPDRLALVSMHLL